MTLAYFDCVSGVSGDMTLGALVDAGLPIEDLQGEIDRLAMAEGLEGSDAYLDQWQWTERRQREGEEEEDIQQVLDALVRELEKEHDRLAELP